MSVVPSVNVIITFSSEPLLNFFRSEGNIEKALDTNFFDEKDTLFIGGASNHNLLRFEQEFGFGNSKDGNNRITLELLDPKGDLEAKFLSPRLASVFADVFLKIKDPLGEERDPSIGLPAALARERQAIVNKRFAADGTEIPEEKLTDDQARRVAEQYQGALLDSDFFKKKSPTKTIIGAQPNLNIFITYGAGSDLSTWAKPFMASFVEAELDFTARGARKIKLIFASTRTPLGTRTDVLGNFISFESVREGQPEVIQAQASILDHTDPRKKLSSEFARQERRFGEYKGIDFHFAYSEVIRDYISKLTGRKNKEVIVLLPSFETHFSKVLLTEKEQYEKLLRPNSDDRKTKEILRKEFEKKIEAVPRTYLELYEVFGKFFTDLGFTVSDNTVDLFNEENFKTTNASFIPAKQESYSVTFAPKIQKTPDRLTIELKSENIMMQKLLLKKLLSNIGEFGNPSVSMQLHYQTDLEILRLWSLPFSEGGLEIGDGETAVVVFGASNLINNFLYGSFNLLKGSPQDYSKGAEGPSRSLGDVGISLLDKNDRFKLTQGFYNENIRNYLFPSDNTEDPSKTVFGRVDRVPELFGGNKLAGFSKEEIDYVNKGGIPVFKTGTGDSNILSLSVHKFNGQYSAALRKTYAPIVRYKSALLGVTDSDISKEISLFGDSKIGKLLAIVGEYTDENGKVSDEYKNIIKIEEDLKERFSLAKISAWKLANFLIEGYNNLAENNPGVLSLWDSQINKGTNSIEKNMMLMDNIYKASFQAVVETLPFFHLSNPNIIGNKQALLFAVEPRFSGISEKEETPTHKVYSGVYSIVGYKHMISPKRVTSSFVMVKGLSELRGDDLLSDPISGELDTSGISDELYTTNEN